MPKLHFNVWSHCTDHSYFTSFRKTCKILGFKTNVYYSYIEHKSGLLLAAEKENQNT